MDAAWGAHGLSGAPVKTSRQGKPESANRGWMDGIVDGPGSFNLAALLMAVPRAPKASLRRYVRKKQR